VDHSTVFRAMMPGLTSTSDTRIVVAHPCFPAPLPLARLDRRGLVFRADGALPRVPGVPYPATLLTGSEPLCSLRLVIREIDAAGNGRNDLTMQPSAAAGDALLWHALRNRASYRHIQGPLAPVAKPCAETDNEARLSRCAAFRLTCRSDALFFADWLEYHFDEFRALAHQRAPHLQLNEIERQLNDDEVGVRFVYDIDSHTLRHALNDCTRAACAWIETEMRDTFALPIAHERFGEHRLRETAGR
jgi:hypothetical protein